MNSWYQISTPPTQVFKPDFSIDLLKGTPQKIDRYDPEVLSDKLLAWFDSFGLVPIALLTFYRYEKMFSNPHIDNTSTGDVVAGAVNFQLEGNARMLFWDDSSAEREKLQAVADYGSLYTAFKDPYKLKLIDRVSFDKGVYLVRTDIAHSVNVVEAPRLLISVRFKAKTSSAHLTWDECVEALSPTLISRQDTNVVN